MTYTFFYCCFQSRIVFSYDEDLYRMGYDVNSQQCIMVPILLPVSKIYLLIVIFNSHVIDLQGPKQIFETETLCIDPQGRAGQILVLLYNVAASSTVRYCSVVCHLFRFMITSCLI